MSKDERKDFYRTIAWGLNRPLFAVYRRVLRMYDDRNHVGKYTPEEIEKLKEKKAIAACFFSPTDNCGPPKKATLSNFGSQSIAAHNFQTSQMGRRRMKNK